MSARGRPAVFLDRDGTLIEDRGHLTAAGEVEFFADTVPALARLARDFVLFIVTNQSGIGKGLITHDHVRDVNAHVAATLEASSIPIREIYVCPHTREDGCECIKPKPLFLERAARDHGIELSRSFVVGDHPSDVELAVNAGAHGIYVLSGHGERHEHELRAPARVVAGIREAADAIASVHAADVLRGGGLVAFPTETVYGLGADCTQEQAVARIFRAKGRPSAHPLIVHLHGATELPSWAAEVPPAAALLASKFWPGPLTMILKRGERVPRVVTGDQDTVGLRVPAHPLTLAMLRELDRGVAGPSANRFGKVSPTTADHVRDDLQDRVDYVLDGGECDVGIESTIIDLSSARPAILRPGAITKEAIERVLGEPIALLERSTVRAPGQLRSHYAPDAEVVIVEPAALAEAVRTRVAEGRRVAVIAMGDLEPGPEVVMVARTESLEALAHDLYANMREADRRGAHVIIVSLPDPAGIGAALLDRLEKAAAPRS